MLSVGGALSLQRVPLSNLATVALQHHQQALTGITASLYSNYLVIKQFPSSIDRLQWLEHFLVQDKNNKKRSE